MKKQIDIYKREVKKEWIIEKSFYKRVMLIWTYTPSRIVNCKSLLCKN